MQTPYPFALDQVAEMTEDKNSCGLRPGRSCADAVEQCFTAFDYRNPARVASFAEGARRARAWIEFRLGPS
jgi:retron-type reverse transcriptase